MLIGLLLRRGGSGVTLRRLRANPSGVDLGPLRPDQLPERLPAPRPPRRRRTGAGAGGPRPAARRSRCRVPGELLLIGRRHQRDCNSWMHNTERLTRGRPRHQLLMNPADLVDRGLDRRRPVVTVSSRVGSVAGRGAGQRRPDAGRGVAPPRLRARARPAPGCRAPRRCRASRSTTSPTPTLLDVSGNAALSGVPVTVTGASPQDVPDAPDVPRVSPRAGPARPPGPPAGPRRRARPRRRPRRCPSRPSPAGRPRAGPRRPPSTAR